MKKKDYKKWHDRKSLINDVANRPDFHEREVWYCHLGENIGYEQDGKGRDYLRPILIVRKFNNEILWGIPLTSTIKGSRFYSTISFGSGTKSSAILSQIRLIDAKRLSYRIGIISRQEIRVVIEQFKKLLP